MKVVYIWEYGDAVDIVIQKKNVKIIVIMHTKICTSIEQSKKLRELGIDRKTSDMYYWCGSDLRIGGYRAQDEELDIPAWSLSALLELIPSVIGLANHEGKYNIRYANEFIIDQKLHDSYIDACYEMIIKLKEQNLI